MDKSGDLWARYVQLGNCSTLFALAFTFAFVLFETSKASFWLFPRCFRDIRLGTWGLKCVNNAIFDIMYFHSRHFFKTYLALNPFWLHQFISSFFNFFLCNNKKILPLPKTLFISHNGHHEMEYKHFCFIKNIWWMFFHDMTFK